MKLLTCFNTYNAIGAVAFRDQYVVFIVKRADSEQCPHNAGVFFGKSVLVHTLIELWSCVVVRNDDLNLKRSKAKILNCGAVLSVMTI